MFNPKTNQYEHDDSFYGYMGGMHADACGGYAPTGVYRSYATDAVPSGLTKDEQVQQGLAEVMAQQGVSYHFTVEDALKSDKKFRYIIGFDEIKALQIKEINGNKVTMMSSTKYVPGLPKVQDYVDIEIQNKLPKEILRELLASFKAIYDRDATEAAAQIYKKRDTGEFFIYYPTQTNTAASSNYTLDRKATTELRLENDLIMEVHSHASMNAFFSGTDDANETEFMFYGVFGQFQLDQAMFVARFRVGKTEKRLTIGDIFEGATSDDLALSDLPDPSAELLAKASKPVYAAGKYVGFQRGEANPMGFGRDPNTPYAWSPRGRQNLQSGVRQIGNEAADIAWLVESLSQSEKDALFMALYQEMILKRRPAGEPTIITPAASQAAPTQTNAYTAPKIILPTPAAAAQPPRIIPIFDADKALADKKGVDA